MTPRELPKYEVLFSFRSLLSSLFKKLAGSGPFSLGEPTRKSFPKPLPGQLLKDREKLSK